MFGLYVQSAPAELFNLLQRQMGVKVRNGIYSARLVIWMMINQRLQARGTLASSVEQLVQGRFDSLLLESGSPLPYRVYLLDGSSLQLEQEPELVQAFPPASNQHGKSHGPVVRLVLCPRNNWTAFPVHATLVAFVFARKNATQVACTSCMRWSSYLLDTTLASVVSPN